MNTVAQPMPGSQQGDVAPGPGDNMPRQLISLIPAAVYTCDAEGRITYFNPRAAEIWGQVPLLNDSSQKFNGAHRLFRTDGSPLPREEAPMADAILRGISSRNIEVVVERIDGARMIVSSNIDPIRDANGAIIGAVNVFDNVTDRKRSEILINGQNRALQLIISGAPLAAVLSELVQIGEAASCGSMVASVMLIEESSRTLRVGAAPSLQDEFRRAIDGVPVEAGFGSASAAVSCGEIVVTPNIANDEAWHSLRASALASGLRAAWSMPIISSAGKVVGTFDTYFREIRRPVSQDVAIVEVLCRTAAVAIERLRTESELQESRDQLAIAMAAGRMGSWSWDLATGQFYWSREYYQLMGYEATDALPKPEMWRGRMHPDDLERVDGAIRVAASRGGSYEEEYRVVWPDGSVHWLQCRGKCVASDAGETVRMTGVIFEITSLKSTEAELRRREQLYRGIGEAIDYGIWVCDPEGRNTYASESFLQLLGITQEQFSEFHWTRTSPPSDAEATMAAWKECVRSGEFWEREHAIEGSDGKTHHILSRGVPIRDESGQVISWAGIHLDITALKRTENALREAQSRLLQHAEDLERRILDRTTSLRQAVTQMEEFSYTVSHDVRAPLRAMKGFAEVLLEEYGERVGEGRYYIERIVHNGNRLEKLVNDLLTASRLGRGSIRCERVSLRQVFDEIIEEHAEMRLPRAIITADALPDIDAHEPSLRQALANLLQNAVKFVKPGVIPQVRVGAKAAEEGVWIWVKDNGIGVRREDQERIFVLFERIHPESHYEGTGIGLAIVRRAVERMGGQVGVESDGETGSRFWIYLPKRNPNA